MPATKRHARELARILRPQDLEETKASSGCPDAAIVIRASINRSMEAYAAYVGNDLVCVFGVTPLRQGAAPWMLSSIHVDKHAMTFWRCSKIAVKYFREFYPLLMNMVHCKYSQALRWVERLGFTLSPPEPFGPKKILFCRATMVTQGVTLV